MSTSTDGTMKIWQAANGEIRVRAAALFGVVLSVTLQSHSTTTWVRLSACCEQAKVWLLIEKLMEICTSQRFSVVSVEKHNCSEKKECSSV